jgi:hypothetical protein
MLSFQVGWGGVEGGQADSFLHCSVTSVPFKVFEHGIEGGTLYPIERAIKRK